MDNNDLVNIIKEKSYAYLDKKEISKNILNAFKKTDRINFVPNFSTYEVYYDVPLQIGYGQTCSQPSMVAFMLDHLEIRKGDKILEIGSGCGYALAISSILAGEGSYVFGIEIIKELFLLLENNLKEYQNIRIFNKDGSEGLIEHAPFDKIFISAGIKSSNFDENILLAQLNENGILLYPETFGNIYKLKKEKHKIIKDVYYGVSFVPLVGKNA